MNKKKIKERNSQNLSILSDAVVVGIHRAKVTRTANIVLVGIEHQFMGELRKLCMTLFFDIEKGTASAEADPGSGKWDFVWRSGNGNP